MNETADTPPQPRAFISYSHTTDEFKADVRKIAERLLGDGIDVVLDQWDLLQGQDMYKFMERMVNDVTVTHVLIFSDATYVQKANDRERGVGTESQIISPELYNSTEQTKFIPVFFEFDENDKPCLPTFISGRRGIDFSSPALINQNWEELVRVLHGQPQFKKPTVGKKPAYLDGPGESPLPTTAKFESLKHAILSEQRTVPIHRDDFIEAVIGHLDEQRPRTGNPADITEEVEENVLAKLKSYLPLRDQIIDWINLEARLLDDKALGDILSAFLEKLLAMKYPPDEMRSFTKWWFEPNIIFVYETFMYLCATLINGRRFEPLNHLLTRNYFLPDIEAMRGRDWDTVDAFLARAEVLSHRNKRLNLQRLNLLADIIKERATRRDLPFEDILQAELVILLISAITNQFWYPHTLIYADNWARFPLFKRATLKSEYSAIATLTGIQDPDDLRGKVHEGLDRLNLARSREFVVSGGGHFWKMMNMDHLATEG